MHLAQNTLADFRVHRGVIFWLSAENIVRFDGATNKPLIVGMHVEWFEVDDNGLYFVSRHEEDGRRSIHGANYDGTGVVEIVSSARLSLALDGDRIFYDGPPGGIYSIPKTGGASESVPGPASMEQVRSTNHWLIDSTHLYWNEGPEMDNTLKRVAKGTSKIETVATHLPGLALQLEGDYVLLTARREYILQMPKGGGCLQWLARGSETMAADDEAIYWLRSAPDTGDLLLSRAPRQGGLTIEIIAAGSGYTGGWGGKLFLLPGQVVFTGSSTNGANVLFLER